MFNITGDAASSFREIFTKEVPNCVRGISHTAGNQVNPPLSRGVYRSGLFSGGLRGNLSRLETSVPRMFQQGDIGVDI